VERGKLITSKTQTDHYGGVDIGSRDPLLKFGTLPIFGSR